MAICLNSKKESLSFLWNAIQKINSIAEAYNLSPEVISTSKSLIRFIRGDLSAPLCSGWRAKLFNKEELNAK